MKNDDSNKNNMRRKSLITQWTEHGGLKRDESRSYAVPTNIDRAEKYHVISLHIQRKSLEKILSLNLTYSKEKSSSRFLAKQKNKSDDLPSMHDIMRRL